MATTQSIPLQPLDGQTPDAQPAPNPVQSQDGGSPPVELDYRRRLVHRMKVIENEMRTKIPLWDHANLQHLNLFHLDCTLRNIQDDDIDISKTTTEPQCKLLRETLHNYATALRDYKYLLELPRDRCETRRLILDIVRQRPKKQATDAVREFLRKRLPIRLSYSREEQLANYDNYRVGDLPVNYSPFVDRLARFLIAVGGGAALIVPMLIMSFQPSHTKSLVTVSVAVLLFALTLSLAFSTDNKDTLQATCDVRGCTGGVCRDEWDEWDEWDKWVRWVVDGDYDGEMWERGRRAGLVERGFICVYREGYKNDEPRTLRYEL